MEYVESFKQNKKWSTLSWHCPFMYVCTSMFIIFNWSETHLYGLHVLVQYSMYSLTPSSSGDRSQLSPLGGGPWFSPKYHAQSEIELPRIHAPSLHLYHQTYCSLYSCVLASNSRIHPAYCALMRPVSSKTPKGFWDEEPIRCALHIQSVQRKRFNDWEKIFLKGLHHHLVNA